MYLYRAKLFQQKKGRCGGFVGDQDSEQQILGVFVWVEHIVDELAWGVYDAIDVALSGVMMATPSLS